MSESIKRAAEVLRDCPIEGYSDMDEADELAQALADHDLLATPERDAEQRRAGAAEALDQVRAALRAEVVIRDYEQRDVLRADLWALAGQFTPEWLDRLHADRIEAQ